MMKFLRDMLGAQRLLASVLVVALVFATLPSGSQSRDVPVPAWTPSFAAPLSAIVERMSYYTDGSADFVVFEHGTAVLIPAGLTDEDAVDATIETLQAIFNFHPDMNPVEMDDGNILVRYNHPAYNVVIRDIALDHWAEIEDRHLDGLAEAEVLITPLGQNVFDDFGKMALLGRSYFFLDAQAPEVAEIVRGKAQ